MCQRHAEMSKKETASKVLPESLPKSTWMSDENVSEKLNYMDGTRPVKHKRCMKKDIQYNTTLSKGEVVEDSVVFFQTQIRQFPEFRAHCDRAFT